MSDDNNARLKSQRDPRYPPPGLSYTPPGQDPSSGHHHPGTSFPPNASSYSQPPPALYSHHTASYSHPSHSHPPGSFHSQPPPALYSHPPGLIHSQPPPSSYSHPPNSYSQPPPASYSHPPGLYQSQPQPSSYSQPPGSIHFQPPLASYSQPPPVSYSQTSGVTYSQAPGAFPQTSSGSGSGPMCAPIYHHPSTFSHAGNHIGNNQHQHSYIHHPSQTQTPVTPQSGHWNSSNAQFHSYSQPPSSHSQGFEPHAYHQSPIPPSHAPAPGVDESPAAPIFAGPIGLLTLTSSHNSAETVSNQSPASPNTPQLAVPEEVVEELDEDFTERDDDWPPIGAIPVQLLLGPKIGKQFIERENGVMYMNAVARHQGYAVAIKSHKKSHGQTIRLYLRCALGHKVPSVATKRSSSSKKTGCLFEVSLNYQRRFDRWVVCQDESNDGAKKKHNHPPFKHPHNLAVYQRFNPASSLKIDLLTSAGCRVAQIKSLLDVEPGSQPLLRDIHNVRTRLRANWLNGRTPIQGLFDLIIASHWAYRTSTSPDGTLLNLFFASPSGIRLARRFPTVLSMDYTYKTNRFNLPLLHIVGTTNTHRSFTVAMCFLTNEKQDQYEWALSKLKEIIYQDEDDQNSIKLPETFATDAENRPHQRHRHHLS